MPKFKVTLPDGQIYNVNGPKGTTKDDALAYVERMLSPRTETSEDLEPARPIGGFWDTLKESAVTLPRYGLEALAYQKTLTEGKEDIAQRDALVKAAESKYAGVGFGQGRNWDAFKQLAGGSIGNWVAPIAAGAATAATGVGAPAAPAVGFATRTAQYDAQMMARLAQERQAAEAEGRPVPEYDPMAVVGGAVASSALDSLQVATFSKLFRAMPFAGKVIAGEPRAVSALVQAARSGNGSFVGGVFKGAVKGVSFEVPQELAQSVLERNAAGLVIDYRDPGALEEYKQAALGAAILGPLAGGIEGALPNRQPTPPPAATTPATPPTGTTPSVTPVAPVAPTTPVAPAGDDLTPTAPTAATPAAPPAPNPYNLPQELIDAGTQLIAGRRFIAPQDVLQAIPNMTRDGAYRLLDTLQRRGMIGERIKNGSYAGGHDVLQPGQQVPTTQSAGPAGPAVTPTSNVLLPDGMQEGMDYQNQLNEQEQEQAEYDAWMQQQEAARQQLEEEQARQQAEEEQRRLEEQNQEGEGEGQPRLFGLNTPPPKPPADERGAPLRGHNAAFHLAQMAEQEGVDLTKLAREDYVEYAIRHGVILDDTQLREHPDNRSAKSGQELLDRGKARYKASERYEKQSVEFANMMEAMPTRDNPSGVVGYGNRALASRNNSNDNSWYRFHINGGINGQAETQPKGYLGFKNAAKSLTGPRFKLFMNQLADAGYRGQIKTIRNTIGQANVGDQVVFHGATDEDVTLAHKIAVRFFGNEVNFRETGFDTRNQSYSQWLMEENRRRVLAEHKRIKEREALYGQGNRGEQQGEGVPTGQPDAEGSGTGDEVPPQGGAATGEGQASERAGTKGLDGNNGAAGKPNERTDGGTPPLDGNYVPKTDTRFQRGPKAGGMLRDKVETFANKLTAGWKNLPKVNVIQSVKDAPASAGKIFGDAKGFVHNGEIYIVADNAVDESGIRGTLFHEALGHAGLRAAFGNALRSAMLDIYNKHAGIRKAVHNWLAKNPDTYSNLSKEDQAVAALEELFAEHAEGGPEAKNVWIAQAFNKVASVIRKFMRDLGIVSNYTLNDIMQIIHQSHDAIISGGATPAMQGATRFQRGESEVSGPYSPKAIPSLSIDNPGGEWLENKRKDAATYGKKSSGAPVSFGAVTASYDNPVTLPLSLLKNLRGVEDEQNNVRSESLDSLVKHMGENNRLPLGYNTGREYSPFITVDQNGTPFVNEGNHRIMAAAKLGWDYLPVNIRYFNGGERVDGILKPSTIKEKYGAPEAAPDTKFQRGEKKEATIEDVDSEGVPLHPTPEGIANAKRLFADSKVVDSEGRLLRMYTGTSKDRDFTKFNIPKNGVWFTSNRDEASMYSMTNDSQNLKPVWEMGKPYPRYEATNTASRVMPVYLNITKPYKLTEAENKEYQRTSNYKKWQANLGNRLRLQGYDGIDWGNGVWSVIGKPEQIKSAMGNAGEFSVLSPDIRYQRAQQNGSVNTIGTVANSLQPGSVRLMEDIRNALSKVPDFLHRAYLGFLSLPQLADLYGRTGQIPSLHDLNRILEERAAKMVGRTQVISANIRKWFKIANLHTDDLPRFYDIAHRTTIDQIDVLDPAQANNPLTQEFQSLPEDLQQVYRELRAEYEGYSNELLQNILNNTPPSQADAIRAEYETKRLKVYLPLFRSGEYWLSYQDQNNETVVRSFDSPRERKLAMGALEGTGVTNMEEFGRINQIWSREQPPTGFAADIIKKMRENNASQEMIDSVYSTLMDYMPANSVRQIFRNNPDRGVLGFEPDVFQAYASMAKRMTNQLNNMEYAKALDLILSNIRGEAGGNRSTSQLKNVVDNIEKQVDFLRNPMNGVIVNSASYFSYFWNIAGNISSAIVNLSQMPIVVLPLLSGKYGYGKASSALAKAMGMYVNGGRDTAGSEFLQDFTFYKDDLDEEYKELFDFAVSRSAIRRPTGYEVNEARNTRVEDYTGMNAKVKQGLGFMFQNTERFNREVTLLAAYDLAKSEPGITAAQAREKALEFINYAHGTALAETGPRFFQTGLGKIAFTFKRFAQSQIYMLAKMFHAAFKGESPEVRRIARKQMLGIYGAAYAFAGVQGMPLYGAGTLLAKLVYAMFGDDDEPLDLDENVRSAIGDLGYKGPVNQLLNLDIASRTGFNGLIWRDDPRRMAEVGVALYMAESALGPAYGATRSILEGAKKIGEGDYERGLESMTPSFIRNGLKGMRYQMEGATNKDGVPIVEDVNEWNSFMQIMGFTPADLSEARARAGSMKAAEKKIMERRTALLDRAYAANVEGDIEGYTEAIDAVYKFSMKHPERGVRMDSGTLLRSFKAKRQKEMGAVDGVYLNKNLAPYLDEEYGD